MITELMTCCQNSLKKWLICGFISTADDKAEGFNIIFFKSFNYVIIDKILFSCRKGAIRRKWQIIYGYGNSGFFFWKGLWKNRKWKKQNEENIRKFLNGLHPDYQSICYLKFYENLKYQQISKIVGIPVGTIKSRLNKIKLDLKIFLGEIDEME